MPLHHPRPLVPGDHVAIVSPAGPVLEEHVAHGIQTLEDWGLVPELRGTFARHAPEYLAGSDAHRHQHFLEAWLDPAIAAIVCARGGYGTMRLLEELDAHGDAIRNTPKLLVGFSDITALHLWLATQGIPSLHGPVAKSFSSQVAHVPDLKNALFGGRDANQLEFSLRPVVPGKARGPVFGGNLSIVASMLASRFCPELNGAILILEDVGEADYRLDRLFTTLRISDRAHRPAAIVLGDFTGCGGVYVAEDDIPTFVEGLAAEFGVPVLAGFPSGHAARNVAFPVGTEAEVDANAGTLRFLTDVTGAKS